MENNDSNKNKEITITFNDGSRLNINDDGEELKQLKDDPVVKLLLSSVAYQSQLISNDIVAMQDCMIDTFLAESNAPYLNAPSPAVAFLQVQNKNKNKSGVEDELCGMMDSTVCFRIGSPKIPLARRLSFVPLLKVPVVNAETVACIQKDTGVFCFEIAQKTPIPTFENIPLFFPRLNGSENIQVFINGSELEVRYLHEFSSLPFIDEILHTGGSYHFRTQYQLVQNIYDSLCFGKGLYVLLSDVRGELDNDRLNGHFYMEIKIDGFSGSLEKDDILFNCIPVANISIRQSVSLSNEKPLAKIDESAEQFLSIAGSIDSDKMAVRCLGTERQNPEKWARQMKQLVSSYMQNHNIFGQRFDRRMEDVLAQLAELCIPQSTGERLQFSSSMKSKYFVLNSRINGSLSVSYLTTSGSKANGIESVANVSIDCSTAQFDSETIRFMTNVSGGRDAESNQQADERKAAYLFRTSDIITTRSDIIDFCNHYLETLFTIRNAKIDISSQIVDVGNNMCQRKINVDIVVNIDRDCAEIENVLNRMAQSRTNTVTPIAIHVKKCPNK